MSTRKVLTLGVCAALSIGAARLRAQAPPVGHTCACGAHPPGPPLDREVTPYASEPLDLSPYAKFAQPYDLNYTHPNIYSGAGRDLPEPADISEVRIGFLGPIEHNPEEVFGRRMLHGAQLAIEEANTNGGYGGKPFRLMLHNDYDNWQAKAAYGEDRPTDAAIWGSASNEVVKMVYDDQDWAVFGSISSESTHIALRVALRAEIPIVNSASTDPTIPETYIPWYFTDLQDDRVQCLTLARRIFTELGLKRVAILRVNNRYGRFGVLKLRDAARRLGHPIVIEQKYLPGDRDYSRQLRVIQSSRADAIVLWADQEEAAGILTQMQKLGMKQRVFGSYRTLGPELLANAGNAAEGFEAVFPYDPTRNDPRWIGFTRRFEERFHEPAEQFAALAYDAMNMLLESICRAGLNRARIHDALAQIDSYDGVTARMIFDPNQKNVAPMYLGSVHAGAITYRLARMERGDQAGAAAGFAKGAASTMPGTFSRTSSGFASDSRSALAPYARVGEEGVTYTGPPHAESNYQPPSVVVFGPHADERSLHVPDSAVSLIFVRSEGNWGVASTQLVHALFDEHAIAIVALDRDSAHLAEQMALKAFVPVIALSDDAKLTSTNVPWIFRLSSGTEPAAALALLNAAVKKSGADAVKLREILASGELLNGVAFLSTGEPKLP